MADYMVEETSGARAIRYGRLVVAIHWISALLILTQVAVGFRFHRMLAEGSAERMDAFAWHKTLGALILLLGLVRLGVRLIDAPPPYPADFPKWERFAAVWNHRIFYFLIIALPLTGLAAVSGRAKDGMVALRWGLELPAIPGIPKENGFGDMHEILVWTTIVLLVLHVAAALKNQFVDRGPVADRMPPFRSTR